MLEWLVCRHVFLQFPFVFVQFLNLSNVVLITTFIFASRHLPQLEGVVVTTGSLCQWNVIKIVWSRQLRVRLWAPLILSVSRLAWNIIWIHPEIVFQRILRITNLSRNILIYLDVYSNGLVWRLLGINICSWPVRRFKKRHRWITWCWTKRSLIMPISRSLPSIVHSDLIQECLRLLWHIIDLVLKWMTAEFFPFLLRFPPSLS